MEVPVACTLTPQGAIDRIEEWRVLLGRAVTAAERPRPDRLELQLADDGGLVAAVIELAGREKACCGFFRFTLEIGPKRSTLVVEVPDQAVPILTDFASLAGHR